MQRNLEPVIRPSWTELISFLGWFVCLPLSFGERRLRPSWSGPDLELDVIDVVETVCIEERG